MTIKRIKDFPDGSGLLSNDDIILFMDNPSSTGTTKKISLSQLSSIIGGGGGTSFAIESINLHNSLNIFILIFETLFFLSYNK